MDYKVKISQLCGMTDKKVNVILGCVKTNIMVSRGDSSAVLGLARPCLEHCI